MPAPIKTIADFFHEETPGSISTGLSEPYIGATATGGFRIAATAAYPYNSDLDRDVNATNYAADGVEGRTRALSEALSSETSRQGTFAELDNGGYVAVWTTEPGDGSGDQLDVRAEVYDRDGNTVVMDFLVAGGADDQTHPVVAASPDGGFAIAYRDLNGTDRMVMQIYDDGGTLETTIDPANTTAGVYDHFDTDYSFDPVDMLALENGNYVLAWTATDFNTRARVFSSDGTPNGNDFEINAGPSAAIFPRMTELADGRFLITTFAGYTVSGSIHNPDGTVSIDHFPIASGTSASSDGAYADVAALQDGRFVAVWTNTAFELKGQVMNADGTPDGAVFDVASVTNGSQHRPSITTLADGRFAVAWETSETGTPEIKAAVFDPRETGVDFVGSRMDDFYIGSAHDDIINGARGDDTIEGGAGNDLLQGDRGADQLTGDTGDDTLRGGTGNDILFGDADEDQLLGGHGNDWLFGGVDGDTLTGDSGRDVFVFNSAQDNSADVITDYQAGQDTVFFANSLPEQISLSVSGGDVIINGITLTGAASGNVTVTTQNHAYYAGDPVDDIEVLLAASERFYIWGGAYTTTVFDVNNDEVFAREVTSYDGIGQKLSVLTENDNGSSVLVSYDVNSTQTWITSTTYKTAAGLTDLRDITYDDNTRIVTDFDQGGTLPWVTSLTFYNAAGQQTARRVNYDDGRFEVTNQDFDSSQPWTTKVDTYTDGVNRDFVNFNNDDGTRKTVDFDQLNNQTWSSREIFYNASNAATSFIEYNDDGTRRSKVYDPDDAANWNEILIVYDVNGNQDFRRDDYDTGENGSIAYLVRDFDNLNEHAWDTHYREFDINNQLINEYYI